MSDIKLTVIGSGATLPTKSRKASCFLLEYSKVKILLDCGYGALQYLVDNNVCVHEIDAVFVTHFHNDHFSDCFTSGSGKAWPWPKCNCA